MTFESPEDITNDVYPEPVEVPPLQAAPNARPGMGPPSMPTPNRAARRRAERMKPLEAGQAAPPKAGGGLSQLFGGGAKAAPYAPVLTSLEQIGLEPRMMEVMIGEDPVQCFVIPAQDLVYKEWQYMTKAKYALEPATGEREEDGQ